MATNSPAKKRPKLSLKFSRKEKIIAAPEEDPNDCNNGTTENQCFEDQCALADEIIREVPAPYCGLYNLGNTCYFNSVLQALRYTPGFSEGLKRLADVVQDTEDPGASSEATSKKPKTARSRDSRPVLQLVVKLNQLFEEMASKEDAFLCSPSADEDMGVYPEEVLSTVKVLNPIFQGYLQHDSQELLCCLLSQLQDASQKLLQLAKEKQSPKSNKHSKLLLVSNKDAIENSADSVKKNNKSELNCVSNGKSGVKNKQVTDRKGQSSLKTPVMENGLTNISEASSNGVDNIKTGCVTSHSGKGKRRKRNSSTRDSEADGYNGDQTPRSKVKRRSRSLTPSSDSLVKDKKVRSPSGDHCLNGADENTGISSILNGSGDASGKPANELKPNSGKKRRLGVGRIRVPVNQPTILSKFGIAKKDVAPINGISKDLLSNGVVDRGENGSSETNSHVVNGNCKTLLQSDIKTSPTKVVCFNQTNNNSNEIKPHVPNSPKKTTKQLNQPKSGVSDWLLNSQNASTPTNKTKTGCLETEPKTNEVEVECLETLIDIDRYLQVVEKMFQGALVLRTRCMECEGCTERREDFQDISVPVQGMEKTTEEDEDEHIPEVRPNNLSLSWALSEFACAERLTADNKYFCESCRHHAEAERTMLFGSLPPVLSIQLKRFCAFSGSLAFGGVSKVNDHLATPMSLCLNQWCTKQCRQRNQKYALYAVVMHSGMSSSSGHYVCYVKIPSRNVPPTCTVAMEVDKDDAKEVWGHFDDERVTVLSDHEFSKVLHPISTNFTTATPYLLFYRQIQTM